MKKLITFAALLLSSLPLAASSLLIESFDNYQTTTELQAAWNSFGTAATAGPPVLHIGEGVAGSNAARFALDWRGAANTNANARRFNYNGDLSAYDAIAVVARMETRAGFAPPPVPTRFKVAIQGANGAIWQTPNDVAPSIVENTYQTYTFSFADMTLVDGSGTLEEALQNISNFRLRFENDPAVQSREDVFFDRVEAIVQEGGGGGVVEVPNLRIVTSVEIYFDTAAGQIYQVQSSADLVLWEDEGDMFEGTGDEVSRLFSIRQDPPKAFFRVLTTAP
jgi:hypothetical protein